jgi:fumarate hydratase class II
MMVHNVLQSAQLLNNAVTLFAEKCVEGLQANPARCQELAEKSLMLVTGLNPYIGYDRAAKVAQEAYRRGVSVKQIALEQKLITEEQAKEIFNLRQMTEPGAKGAGGG